MIRQGVSISRKAAIPSLVVALVSGGDLVRAGAALLRNTFGVVVALLAVGKIN